MVPAWYLNFCAERIIACLVLTPKKVSYYSSSVQGFFRQQRLVILNHINFQHLILLLIFVHCCNFEIITRAGPFA
jgi:hypothetical protein